MKTDTAIFASGKRGSLLLEVMCALAVLSFGTMGVVQMLAEATRLMRTAEKKASLNVALVQQMQEAQSLPLNTILSGGTTWGTQTAAGSTRYVAQTESFFNGVSDNTWWRREAYGDANIYGSTNTGAGARSEVRWMLRQGQLTFSKLNYYEIIIEVRLKDGVQEDIVTVGRVLRVFERGVI